MLHLFWNVNVVIAAGKDCHFDDGYAFENNFDER